MRNHRFQQLLLVAALAFGQWLAIAHDAQHPLLGDGEQGCQVCLHGHNLQAGPRTAPVLACQPLAGEAPLVAVSSPALARRHTQASIRAPPIRLV